MTCQNPCSKEQEILDRLATVEGVLIHKVDTVNGRYGPHVVITIPDVTYLESQVETNKEDIATLKEDDVTLQGNIDALTYVKEILSYTVSPTTFTARVKMRDDSVATMVLPPVSSVNVGIMTPSAYAKIWSNSERIDQILLGTSIPTGDLETNAPSQAELTSLWVTSMSRSPADGDRVLNTYNNVIWLYASDLWYAISSSSTPQATNLTLGTVKGSLNDGQSQVELDGTLSVNGWDAAQSAIIAKLPKITSSATYPRVYTVSANGLMQDVISYTNESLDNSLCLRNANGNIEIGTAQTGTEAVNKSYVDERIKCARNVSILTTDWVTNVDIPALSALGYLYQYTIPITEMLATMMPIVIPSYDTYISGNLWGTCQSISGGVTIYSKQNVGMTILSAIGMVV